MTNEQTVQADQYLTFQLAEEVFALDIRQVREVLDFTDLTRVPQTPEFMCGVINLRGGVVPVVDMRLKFGMAPTARTVNTCIIIVEVATDDETMVVGALADSVQEVLELATEQVEPPPKLGSKLNIDFIKGIGKRDEDFIILLDIDKVFSADEIELVAAKSMDQAAV